MKQYRAEGVTKINPDSGRLGKHAAVAVAEQAAVQMAKLGGLLGLSPVAERKLGSLQPPDDPTIRLPDASVGGGPWTHRGHTLGLRTHVYA